MNPNYWNKGLVAGLILALMPLTALADQSASAGQGRASASAPAVHAAAAHVDTSTQKFHDPIQSGDRMWFIAKASCGNALRYRDFAAVNGISNPNWIIAGKDVLTVLPKGCKATFTPERAATKKHRSTVNPHPPILAINQSVPLELIPAISPVLIPLEPLTAMPLAATEQPAASSVSAPAQMATAKAMKGYLWYVIHMEPLNGRPLPTPGIWTADLVKNEDPKGGKKYHLRIRTGVVVAQHGEGVNVFAQLKHAPTEKDMLLFVDGSGQPFRLRGQYMMANGTTTEFAPVELAPFPRAEYALAEKAFPVTEGGFRRILRVGFPFATSTAIGFAVGGPIGAVVNDGIYAGTAFIAHKKSEAATKLAEAQQQ